MARPKRDPPRLVFWILVRERRSYHSHQRLSPPDLCYYERNAVLWITGDALAGGDCRIELIREAIKLARPNMCAAPDFGEVECNKVAQFDFYMAVTPPTHAIYTILPSSLRAG